MRRSLYIGSYSKHVIYFTVNFNLAFVQSFPITCRPCTHTEKLVAPKSVRGMLPACKIVRHAHTATRTPHTTTMMISKRNCLGVIVICGGEAEIGIHEKYRLAFVQILSLCGTDDCTFTVQPRNIICSITEPAVFYIILIIIYQTPKEIYTFIVPLRIGIGTELN